MPNSFKYSTSAETLALKKGSFWVGTGSSDKGPTSTTGYYNGIIPPAGGYTIYLNKSNQGPSIYVAYSDTELINLTNKIAGTSYSTVNECLNYFAGQSDKLVTNKDYPAIITNGLVLNLDASYTPSYPKNGTTWYDIASGNYNATLYNGTTYNSDNGGSIVFDGTNDYGTFSNPLNQTQLGQEWTVQAWINITSSAPQRLIGGLNNGLWIEFYQGNNSLLYLNGGVDDYYTYGGQFTSQGWVLATFRFNNSNGNRQIWRNLSNISTSGPNNTSIPAGQSGTFTIGSNNSETILGKIGNLLFYNRYLSDTEITQNYNATAFLGSQYNPANSAAAILSANPSATDGYYWINTNLGPRQLYCIMSLGGWLGVTSEISPQIDNLSTTTTWETNTNRRLQSGNSQILNVSLVEGNCGAPTHYQLQSPSSVGISYTQTMLLIQRITTIGQCSSISGVAAYGYYSGPEYSGTYTSNGMCLWGDGVFANACCSAQNVSGLQPYWVMFGSGANQSLRYQVQCAGGTGQHYHMWFVK
jgi:hypothetical protein